VADRWRLLKNLGDTLESLFTRHQEWLRQSIAPEEKEKSGAGPAAEGSAPTSETPAERDRAARREKRLRRYEEVKALQAGGMSLSEIARTTGLARGTVVNYAQAEHFRERARRRPGPADLAPYDVCLRERWVAGCHNGKRLCYELREQGYRGSIATVERDLHARRSDLARSHPHGPHPLTPRQAAWLCTQLPDDLDEDGIYALQQLREVDAVVDLVSAGLQMDSLPG